ncbi:MAG: carboxypeptidase-like regulatory domain-containing protein [Flavobacteriaceae bacterium]|nr:carboxypeptidase-like regulatory domain-containing protein [Flavobacteriaceae bacterium]
MNKVFLALLLLLNFSLFSQVKISGAVVDSKGHEVSYANVVFTGSTIGTVSDENGHFYLESDVTYTEIEISFIGYESKTFVVKQRDFNLRIALNETSDELDEVVIYSGRIKNKGNPAIPILKKIWAKKRENGTHLFKQYQYEKYEKLEFDLNNIDSTMMEKKFFKGMEFIFEGIDTSKITGKSYLPIFLNEAVYETYGNNKTKKVREDLVANKNSGFESNQYVIAFVKDLYLEYNIYDNYIKIFDKSFVSPLSKTGLLSYNYVLTDSAYIEGKWCYNIIYYPRRKNELTFKGDFWVNDSTFAVKEINMYANKSANVNWIKDIYIEQEFDVLNDSVFLLKRDFMLSDFSIGKKSEAKGMYGKRTTMYKNYQFNIDKGADFYKTESDLYDTDIYSKKDDYWLENRQELLNKDESGVYKMLDTLSTVRKFKRLTNLATILVSGYVEFNNWDFGPLFSSVGINDVEGIRLRAGGRTYFGPNDLWRAQGYTAYGFKDDQVKYGISGKWMVNKKNRIILSGGNRRDVEQIGVSLTTTNDVLGRSFASSAFFSSGDSGKLTSINLSNFLVTVEPKKNVTFRTGMSYRTLKSASSTFNMDYYDENGVPQSSLKQTEFDFTVQFTPKRETVSYGVERSDVNQDYARILINYTRGVEGVFESDFDYHKLQFYYHQRFLIGGLGRSYVTFETGKIFGEVPLGLLSIVPGNQSYFLMSNTYSLLDYYDFVTDTHASMHLEHHFNGRFFSKIPLLKKLNLREIVGFRGVWGAISDENTAINASDITYVAPEDIYMEYSAGVGNIFKVFRLDFIWRASYRDAPNAKNFGIKGTFGIHF